jgi:hypothetical protein
VSSGSLAAVVAIQLASLVVPLAAGIAGLVSGATAGLLSVTAWFVVGLPLSYAIVDSRAARRAAAQAHPAPQPLQALAPTARG